MRPQCNSLSLELFSDIFLWPAAHWLPKLRDQILYEPENDCTHETKARVFSDENHLYLSSIVMMMI